MRGRQMKNFQKEEMKRLQQENAELSAEIKALETEIEVKDKMLKQKDYEMGMMRLACERFQKGCNERKAEFEEAKRKYDEEIESIRVLKKRFKDEAEQEIKMMSSTNRTLK